MGSQQTVSALPKAWRQLVLEEKHSLEIKRQIRVRVAKAPVVDPMTSAEVAGLHYVNHATMPGVRRLGGGKRYVNPNGRTVSSPDVLNRIRALAIPPAWRDVWICPHPLGHLQATGRDARGRKQYRYHAKWREVRDEVKYGRLVAFANALVQIRKRTAADLARPGLPREKVLAAVVQLLEKTLIRVGNDEYARDNQSFGLTTMRDKHAVVNATSVRFEFRGKSGIAHRIQLHDPRLARIVKKCRDLPGQELFQYVDDDGRRQVVGSTDVNRYLRDICGEAFTAKDFRTWAGTVLAAQELAQLAAFRSASEAKRNIVRAVEGVAKRLGNTVSVCRKCYIHPLIFDAYLDGNTIAVPKSRRLNGRGDAPLAPVEAAVVAMIQRMIRTSGRRAAAAPKPS